LDENPFITKLRLMLFMFNPYRIFRTINRLLRRESLLGNSVANVLPAEINYELFLLVRFTG